VKAKEFYVPLNKKTQIETFCILPSIWFQTKCW